MEGSEETKLDDMTLEMRGTEQTVSNVVEKTNNPMLGEKAFAVIYARMSQRKCDYRLSLFSK